MLCVTHHVQCFKFLRSVVDYEGRDDECYECTDRCLECVLALDLEVDSFAKPVDLAQQT